MRPLRVALGLVPFTLPLILFGACANHDVALGVIMRAPQGLLDGATAVQLSVIDVAQASCDPVTGSVSGTTDGDDVLSFNMEREGCSNGATWCKEITLDQDGDERVFHVVASGAGETVAQGCTTAAVDQDPLEIRVDVKRFLAPRCCGNGEVEPTEQCDNGVVSPTDCEGNPTSGQCSAIVIADPVTDVCGCDCRAREILLSVSNEPFNNPEMSNEPGTKQELALEFATGGDQLGNGLRAVFTDTAAGVGNTEPDINIRYLNGELLPFTMAALNKQLRLPDSCSQLGSEVGVARSQKQAAIAQVSSANAGVVYASDESLVNKYQIYVSVQEAPGCTDIAPVLVNQSLDDSAEFPDIAAGANGTALIVWNDAGNLRGRIWREDNSFASDEIEVGIMAATAAPRVAGNANGWVVGYQDTSNGVRYRTVSSAGVVGSQEVQVNVSGEGTQPQVAMLSDGRFALSWQNNGGIIMQRYATDGTPVAGDQEAPINASGMTAADPTMEASDDLGGFYAMAWGREDGGIGARYAGGSVGFLFNSVSGQNDDFLASHPTPSNRSHPAIAIGGAGFVAIGWQDNSSDHPGVYVRRMPLPKVQ